MAKQQYDLPYFPLYVADWLNDTQDLFDEEEGAYFRLIRHQWTHGSIPDDMRRMSRISDSIKTTWPVVQRFFVKNDEGNWINKRVERERNKIISKIENGSKGGSKKQANHLAKAEQIDKLDSTIPEPRTQSLDTKIPNLKTTTSNELAVMSYLSDYPSLQFTSMAIPRMLQSQVLDEFGEKALMYILTQVEKVEDLKKRYAPAYVRTIIKNAPLQDIKEGNRDVSGQAPESCTIKQAKSKAEKLKVEFKRYFAPRLGPDNQFQRTTKGSVLYFFYPKGDALKDKDQMRIRENRETMKTVVSSKLKFDLTNSQIPERAFTPAPERDYGLNYYSVDMDILEELEMTELFNQYVGRTK